jgi:hypothetical protein
MGGGSWTSQDWGSYSSSNAGKSTAQIFTQSSIHPDYDPKNITVRESCDSPDHPQSTPIIIAFDVTGSMSEIPAEMVKTGLPTVIEQTLLHKPVPDPQFLMAAVGDARCDRAPFQATQFESDIRIAQQLTDLYLEGNGGGNGGESYHLAWYFAAKKTKTDSLIKRGKKGILFTIGDEHLHPVLTSDQIESVFGDKIGEDISSETLIAMAEKHYDLYHIICTHGESLNSGFSDVIKRWQKILGPERVIVLKDHTHLPEIIAGTLRVHGGEATADVVSTWSGKTALVVADALKNLPTTKRGGVGKPAVWRPGGPKVA